MEEQHGTGNRGLKRRIKQHIIAGEHELFAIVQPGFEDTARRELLDLGVQTIDRVHEGGLEFRGRLETCYRINLRSRTITRLLMRTGVFRAEHFDRFREKLASIPWELLIRDGSPVSFSITARKSRLYHTGRLEEEGMKALTQRLAEYGMSPAFADGERGPGQKIYIRLENDICRVSLDTSGDELYKRGNKQHIIRAPLRENLAALILHEAGVRRYDCILDPMCGSGTFSLEAAGILTGQAPGMERHFPFMDWPSFRPAAFSHLKKSPAPGHAGEGDESLPEPLIFAADIDAAAVETARSNISHAGLAKHITVELRDFFTNPVPVPAGRKCLLVMNPPYGGRLPEEDVRGLYRRIGRTMGTHYADCGLAVIVPGLDQEKALAISWDRKILFMNGGIRVALLIRDV